MPRSNPYRKKRRTKHKRFRKPKKPMRYQVADMAYSGYKLAKRIWDVVNVEYKYHDTSLNSSEINYSGTLTLLNDPAQGDTDLTRDGDSIKNQNLTVDVMISHHSTQAQVARFLIVWDKQGSVSGVDTILDSTYTGSVLAPLARKDRDDRFKTRILYDSGALDLPPSTTSRAYTLRTINLPINMHTQFEAGTTTINTGRLYFLHIGSRNTASNNATMYMVSRVTYTDN